MHPHRLQARRAHAAASFTVVVLALGACLSLPSCGGRSELPVPPPLPPVPECDVDEDCPGHDNLCAPVICVDPDTYEGELPPLPIGATMPPMVCIGTEPLDCDDNDPCTSDSCVPETGRCTYGPSTLDSDGDGHHAPLPGKVPGEPGSCGDDCDDTSPDAFPGNTEVCDGVDNDCNGVVDDGADYVPLTDPVRISGDIAPAEPGGLAFNGETYMAMYAGTDQGFHLYQTRLDAAGNKLPPIEQPVALQNADAYGGPIAWTGDRYGLAWQDRRDSDYEIYFTLLDGEGSKFIPDKRLSFAMGFSVNVDMAWNGNDFIVVWQDDRNGPFEVLAQRVNVDGVLLGDNVALSPEQGFDDESPSIAVGIGGFGLAFANGQAGYQVIRFRVFEHGSLQPKSELLDLTDGSTEAVYPTVAWNQDHYIVAWYDKTAPVKAIYAATISAEGQIIVPATPVTSPGPYRSRDPRILPLGDRALLVYSDDRDDELDGYEIYTRMIATDLSPIGPERRLTDAPYDRGDPHAAFGPEGDVGVLFQDNREGGHHHVWFTRLGCVTASP